MFFHARELWGDIKELKKQRNGGIFRLTKKEEQELCASFKVIPRCYTDPDFWVDPIPDCLKVEDDDW